MAFVDAIEAAARRALAAGFKVFGIYAAHGGLLHRFLSPHGDQRMTSTAAAWKTGCVSCCA